MVRGKALSHPSNLPWLLTPSAQEARLLEPALLLPAVCSHEQPVCMWVGEMNHEALLLCCVALPCAGEEAQGTGYLPGLMGGCKCILGPFLCAWRVG